MDECIPPSSVRKGKDFVIWLFYEKGAQVVVRFELKKFSLGNFKKSVFQSILGHFLLN